MSPLLTICRNRPTVAERIDPASPHYDAAFAALRRSAYEAYTDHQRDMQNKPDYRKAVKRLAPKRR